MKLLAKMRLKRVYLNEIKLDLSDQKRPPVRSMILMAATVLLFAASISDYIYARHRIDQVTGASDFSFKANNDPTVAGPDPEEIDAAQKSVNQLALPWGVLFSAMEAIRNDHVVLISLEPDAQKRSVRIVAEAPDVYQMLEYIQALKAQPQISKVYLANQKSGEDQQNPSVRFTLDGYWAQP